MKKWVPMIAGIFLLFIGVLWIFQVINFQTDVSASQSADLTDVISTIMADNAGSGKAK